MSSTTWSCEESHPVSQPDRDARSIGLDREVIAEPMTRNTHYSRIRVCTTRGQVPDVISHEIRAVIARPCRDGQPPPPESNEKDSAKSGKESLNPGIRAINASEQHLYPAIASVNIDFAIRRSTTQSTPSSPICAPKPRTLSGPRCNSVASSLGGPSGANTER